MSRKFGDFKGKIVIKEGFYENENFEVKKLEWIRGSENPNFCKTAVLFRIGNIDFWFQIIYIGGFNVFLSNSRHNEEDIEIADGFSTVGEAQAAAQKYYNQFLEDMKNADN